MKKKSPKKQTNNPVTKTHFDEAVAKIDQRFVGIDKTLEGMDKRFEGIDKKLEGVDDRFDRLTKAFHNEMSFMAESIIERLEKRMMENTSRVLSVIDPFLKELEASRQERTLSAHQMASANDRLDDHEKRLNKLEHS